jgi:pyruvate,orthophosphate dikinase
MTIREGAEISIDGLRGEVYLGALPTVIPDIQDPWLTRLMEWADDFRTLEVWANADYADDAKRARSLGAQGIGLCRTEHMFFEEDRLPVMREMIMARTSAEREAALDKLLPLQRGDFEQLFRAMDGLPVVVRLLDPPLHEFLPDVSEMLVAQAKDELDDLGEQLLDAAQRLQEHDPMLGVRGIRLGVIRPEVYRAQVRALLGAAAARKAAGGDPRVEVMLPLVSTEEELAWGVGLIHQVGREVAEELGEEVPYTVATMIETPRAALTGGRLALHVDAFSFGTNDLTQLTFGLSRDDVEATYMPKALEGNLMPVDPFRTLDRDGVGRLLQMAVDEGRAARPDLVTGICGEHGGDPQSIHLAHELALTHVSCSPARLEVARLAAAQAALEVSGPSDTA